MKHRLAVQALVVASIIALVAVVGGAGEAAATPFGVETGGPGYYPDSADHWFCFDGSIPGGSDAGRFYSAMDYLDAATRMYDVPSSYCGSATDVVFRYQSPIVEAPGARGFAPCRVRTGYLNFFCQQGDVIVDVPQIFVENGGWNGNPNTFDLNVHKTIRHEVGHSAGLAHSTGVHVMVSGAVPYNWAYLAYLPHDICHIDSLYGGPSC